MATPKDGVDAAGPRFRDSIRVIASQRDIKRGRGTRERALAVTERERVFLGGPKWGKTHPGRETDTSAEAHGGRAVQYQCERGKSEERSEGGGQGEGEEGEGEEEDQVNRSGAEAGSAGQCSDQVSGN